jgi:hypothetical protein
VEHRRVIDPPVLADMGGRFHPAMLAYVDWPGDPVRVHSGIGPMTWGGHTWRGVGHLGGISLPAERGDLGSVPGQFTLGGDNATINAIHAAAPAALGAEVLVWFVTVTSRAGPVRVGEPFDLWSGYVSDFHDRHAREGRGYRRLLTVEIMPGPSQRATAQAYHSEADQARFFPGDTAGRWSRGAVSRSAAQAAKW